MKEAKEIHPGVNGETFQIRIVDTGMTIVAETNLVYYEGSDEKLANLRNDRYEPGTDINKILEEAKTRIAVLTIIKRETGVDTLKKEEE